MQRGFFTLILLANMAESPLPHHPASNQVQIANRACETILIKGIRKADSQRVGRFYFINFNAERLFVDTNQYEGLDSHIIFHLY